MYDSESQTNDKDEQLVLLYVTYNESIVDALAVLQPEGGLYPLVLMQPWAKKCKLEVLEKFHESNLLKLRKLLTLKMSPALKMHENDQRETSKSCVFCLAVVDRK